MAFARLILLSACLSLSMFAESIEWDCGGVFGACGSTIAIDSSQNPTTYIAQNISVIVPILNKDAGQPNATDTFSFAFQVNIGNFSNIIDQTLIPTQNYGATISGIRVYDDISGLFPGDKVLSVDTFYPKDVLPQAYQTYLGTPTGVGYDVIDFKTTPTQDGGMDYTIDGATIVIDSTPEPGTAGNGGARCLCVPEIPDPAFAQFSLGLTRADASQYTGRRHETCLPLTVPGLAWSADPRDLRLTNGGHYCRREQAPCPHACHVERMSRGTKVGKPGNGSCSSTTDGRNSHAVIPAEPRRRHSLRYQSKGHGDEQVDQVMLAESQGRKEGSHDQCTREYTPSHCPAARVPQNQQRHAMCTEGIALRGADEISTIEKGGSIAGRG
jgi:hypothetical protein